MDKIVCLGKNYLEHAKELGDAVPDKPVIFLKPPSVLLRSEQNQTLKANLVTDFGEVHHECELVVELKFGGYRLSAFDAQHAIGKVSVGLDMTLRTLQAKLKKEGHPWTTAKVFKDAAIVGPFINVAEFPDFEDARFELKLNGKQVQTATAREMILNIVDSIVYASYQFPLCEGDLLFTGTPKGVGPVKKGDKAELKYGAISYQVEWQ